MASCEGDYKGSDSPKMQKIITEVKTQRKVAEDANKLKAKKVSGYSNHSNLSTESNLNENVLEKEAEEDAGSFSPVPLLSDEFSVKTDEERQRDRMAEIQKIKQAIDEKKRQKERMAEIQKIKKNIEEKERQRERMVEIEKIKRCLEEKKRQRERIEKIRKKIEEKVLGKAQEEEELGLTVKELEELRDEITKHLDLDGETPNHVEYWEALKVVCEHELVEAQKDALEHSRIEVEADVRNFLEGKTHEELKVILKQVHLFKAKAFLKEIQDKKIQNETQEVKAESCPAEVLVGDVIVSEEDREIDRLQHALEQLSDLGTQKVKVLERKISSFELELRSETFTLNCLDAAKFAMDRDLVNVINTWEKVLIHSKEEFIKFRDMWEFVSSMNTGFWDWIDGVRVVKKMLTVVLEHDMLSSDKAAIENAIWDMRPDCRPRCVRQKSPPFDWEANFISLGSYLESKNRWG